MIAVSSPAGSGADNQQKFLCILSLKYDVWWHQVYNIQMSYTQKFQTNRALKSRVFTLPVKELEAIFQR